jgi:hypothetical protein
MNKKILTLSAVWVLLLAGLVLAQPPEGRDGPPPRWDRERVETIIIGKFSNELELTTDQAEKFFPRFRQFRRDADGNREAMEARRKLLDDFSSGTATEQVDVSKLLDEQKELMGRMADLRRVFLADVSNYLSPQQVSRCAILMEEMPRRMKMLMEHQGDGQRGDGPPMRQGSGHRYGRGN